MTKMLRTINGWRFELPLAALLALALGFAVLVMPAPMIGTLPGAHRLGAALQPLAAGVAALLGGLVAFGLMFGAGKGSSASRRAAAAVRAEQEDEEHPFGKAFEELMEQPAPAPAPVVEQTVRVRRADAHPDAPPRAPILATRDLGEPFMGFAPDPEPAPAAPAIPDGDYVELPQAARDEAIARAFDAAPPAEPVEEAGIWTDAESEADVPAAPAPEPASPPIARATAPVRPERQSITDMMARLDAGMMRRSGRALPPRDARPALRDALAELNRLAARRG
jgi:hypothetical protein